MTQHGGCRCTTWSTGDKNTLNITALSRIYDWLVEKVTGTSPAPFWKLEKFSTGSSQSGHTGAALRLQTLSPHWQQMEKKMLTPRKTAGGHGPCTASLHGVSVTHSCPHKQFVSEQTNWIKPACSQLHLHTNSVTTTSKSSNKPTQPPSVTTICPTIIEQSVTFGFSGNNWRQSVPQENKQQLLCFHSVNPWIFLQSLTKENSSHWAQFASFLSV